MFSPLAIAVAFTVASASAAPHAWIELAPALAPASGYAILARYADAAGEGCPDILLDGKKQRMSRRLAVGTFQALVCEATVLKTVRTASVNGLSLPLPRWKSGAQPRVVVIGDTGCRVKLGSDDPTQTAGAATWNLQNCDSAKDWPFQEVAASAASTHPDLVIHVGDYLYREKSCTGVKNCPGGPAGDTFATWEADFFEPASRLLRAAPWVVVRGNHESCSRAGNGWFSLLETRPAVACLDFTEPYLIRAGKLPLVMLDNSTATDAACRPTDATCSAQFDLEAQKFTRMFQTVSAWNLKGAWMLSHRPVWSLKKGGQSVQVLNAVLEAAWDSARPQGIDLLLAGHTHDFELIGFGPQSSHATQLVIGNSGTKLAPRMKFDAQAAEVTKASIESFRQLQDFGFTTLTAEAGRWRVEARDRAGTVQFNCVLPFQGNRCGR